MKIIKALMYQSALLIVVGLMILGGSLILYQTAQAQGGPEMEVLAESGVGISDGGGPVDFGDASVDGGTAQQTFTISNTGEATLTLTDTPPVTITGTARDDFTVTQQPDTSIISNTATTFVVEFNPSAEGSRQAEVSIANNDSNENPYTFSIEGNGTVPKIEIRGEGNLITNGDDTPSDTDGTDFGDVLVNGGLLEQTFTISNTGEAPLRLTGTETISVTGPAVADFSVTQAPTTPINSGASTTFTIRFDPSVTGTRTVTLTIANNDSDENPYSFVISGTGVDPEIEITGNGFPVNNGDSTTTTLNGTNFLRVRVDGETKDRSFVIKNTGSATLTLTGNPLVNVTGAAANDFTIVSQPTANQISPGETLVFIVQLDPSELGERKATLRIPNNDTNEGNFNFAVRGRGVLPTINIIGNNVSINNGDDTPSPVDHTDFGSALLDGGLITRTFTISNSGEADLSLLSTVQISGTAASDFTVLQQPSSLVTADGGSTTFTIRFDPSALGLRTAQVTLEHDGSDESPFTFAIQGFSNEVPEPEIDVSGNNQSIVNGSSMPSVDNHTDFGNVEVKDSTLERRFTIINNGNGSLALNGTPKIALSGDHAGDFTVSQEPTSPVDANGGSTIFKITFDPTGKELRTVQVSIASNDSDESPFTFAIQGNGISAENLVYLPLIIK